MHSDTFYQNLTPIDNLKDISHSSYYQPMPSDWYILATDVQGSTKAIEAGRYKDVNMVGALSIIAILNLDKSLDIPFVFGGDGAFVLIPPSLVEKSKQALLAIQKIAQEAYGMHLRIGMIPIHDIYKSNHSILITKLHVTPQYAQAIIKGGGLEYADELLKKSTIYHIKDAIDANFSVDLEGLECRWRDIPSPRDEVLSILIKAHDESIYVDLLEHIEAILGPIQSRHPIHNDNLRLSFSSEKLQTEAAIYTHSFISRQWLLFKLKAINLIGKVLMDFKVGLWSGYKQRIVTSTDTEKFDDMLRMIVSSGFEQTQALEEYLQAIHEKGLIYYGIHKTNASLITCLIFERHGKHIHFVDATQGGYAMAAKMLKSQF